MSERAQAFTLEAFVAAVLLIAAMTFALQSVAIDANTASSGGAELRGQHGGIAEGVLDGAVESGSLQSTLLYWDESSERFLDADEEEGFYLSTNPNTTFGRNLGGMLDDHRIRYNVDLHYRGTDGGRETQRLVEYGTPSQDAVRVTETVTLYDDTTLVRRNESRRANVTLESVESDFYAPDASDDSPVYNVIRVEVVLWRT
ncbi:DUF7288 family protein [Halobellus ordinarius]|uniref:DUF7288 family protein n=1 Tax=Halobellus ordinarius TaxID=3075120 RepID=UPI00288014D9|nr:hypothetical protein [Halobellus sp. ZY16]